MQQHTMEQATIVNVSTKTHPDGIQMNAMKLIMIPSIDTVQNMIISTLTRIEIVMQICKFENRYKLPLLLTITPRANDTTPRK